MLTALLLLIVGVKRKNLVQFAGIFGSFFTFVLSIFISYRYICEYNIDDAFSNSLRFVEYYKGVNIFGLQYYVGVDGLSILMILLTTFITFIVLLTTVRDINTRNNEYISFILMIESLCILVFSAQNLLLFYVAFELILVPMYFVINIWGGDDRKYAAKKFFLYTFFFSLFMLVAIIYIGTFNIDENNRYFRSNYLNDLKILDLQKEQNTLEIEAQTNVEYRDLADSYYDDILMRQVDVKSKIGRLKSGRVKNMLWYDNNTMRCYTNNALNFDCIHEVMFKKTHKYHNYKVDALRSNISNNAKDCDTDCSNIDMQPWLLVWLGIFIGLAVKIPMFPIHTWLPSAHVQAPTGGSMMLAGILLKLGGYGFIRILLPFNSKIINYYPCVYNSYTSWLFNIIMLLSVIAMIYGSFVAFVQKDMKKMIAYSSVAHMGYVTAGIFSNTEYGVKGAIFQMISHGLISAGLFLCVGILYTRAKTKEIKYYGGYADVMPVFSVFFIILVFASIGLPGTSGFIGEFLSLYSIFYKSYILGCCASICIVMGAVYMLSLYKNVMFGNFTPPPINLLSNNNLKRMDLKMGLSKSSQTFILDSNLTDDATNAVGEDYIVNQKKIKINDVSCNETIALVLIVLAIISIGMYPNFVLMFLKNIF